MTAPTAFVAGCFIARLGAIVLTLSTLLPIFLHTFAIKLPEARLKFRA